MEITTIFALRTTLYALRFLTHFLTRVAKITKTTVTVHTMYIISYLYIIKHTILFTVNYFANNNKEVYNLTFPYVN